MKKRPRHRREDPVRTAPIRNWKTLFRRPDSWGSDELDEGGEAHTPSNGERSWDNVVSHSVQLGYKIIEEQIQQGRRVAEQVRERSYGTGELGNDASELVERILHFYTDLGSLCFELIETLAHNRILNGEAFRGRGAKAPGNGLGGSHESASGQHSVSIEIVSGTPTQVTLNLNETPNGSLLAAHDLHALDAGKPPLRDIVFERGDGDGPPILKISIPTEQPPDIYSGAVIDKDTNLPVGTLCIRVRE
jgi:hypothetical protein